MNRLLIILFFCTALFDTSYGQKPKEKKSKATVITKTVDSKENTLNDTAFLNQLAKVYGDSVLAIVDTLLKDTAFLKSIGDTSVFGYGEFASSQYKVQFPIKALGWTSDFEHIFSSDQVSELDSIISSFEKETTNEIAIVTIDSSFKNGVSATDIINELELKYSDLIKSETYSKTDGEWGDYTDKEIIRLQEINAAP